MKIKWIFLFIVTIFCLLSISFSQSKLFVRNFTKISNLMLCESSLNDFMELFGKANIEIGGDAAKFYKRINYFLVNENTFISITESEMCVISICLSKVKPEEEYSINSIFNFSSKDLNGLKLGLTKNEVLIILPQENNISDDSSYYQYINKIKEPDGELFDELITIEPNFQNEILVKLIIHRVVSN